MKILEQKQAVLFDVDLKTVTWVKAKDVDGQTLEVDAIGVNNKGNYGARPWLVAGNVGVNLPAYMLDQVKEILGDIESVDAIKNGHITASFEKFTTRNGNQSVRVGFHYVD